jgi:hypothetical protein
LACEALACVRTNVRLIVRCAHTGRRLRTIRASNKIPSSGLNLTLDLLKGDTTARLTYFGVGTGTTAPAAADTTLQTEVFRAAITRMSRAAGTLTVTYFLPQASANGSTLTEAGMLNASSGGTLFGRVTHTGIGKTANVTITYVWRVTFGTVRRVTTAGLNLLCDLLKGDSVAKLTYIGYGTNATAFAVTDTALGAEATANALVRMRRTGTGVLEIEGYLGSRRANSSTLREAGLRNAVSGGTLFCRDTHSDYAKDASTVRRYTWTLTLTATT